jgi:undecaprenyl-diphosphatase
LTYLQAAILGLVQGLTEFLPVSSSGHLVIGTHLLGANAEGNLLFDVLVHFGTLVAVLVVFREKILAIAAALLGRGSARDRKLAGLIVLGSIPAAFVGLLLEDLVEHLFGSVQAVAIALLVTGVILRFAREQPAARREVGLLPALAIGVGQALAITPGISRSGTTIALALRLGIAQAEAAEFSFLLAIPAIGGAFVLKLSDAIATGSVDAWGPYVLGTLLSALSGWAALRWLLALLRGGRFHLFSWYCWAVGGTTLIWSLLAGN